MATFNELTRTSDYERQSWRDSYNRGNAAGDITGNVNRSLNEERDRFQGATWSGSSSEYSALEYARVLGSSGGVGTGGAAIGGSNGLGGSVTSGPGGSGVVAGSVAASGGGAGKPGKDGDLKTTRIVINGYDLPLMRNTSDGGDGEDRWGDVGGSIYGLGVMLGDGWSVGSGYVRDQSAKGQKLIDERARLPKQQETMWDVFAPAVAERWNEFAGYGFGAGTHGDRPLATGTKTGGGF